MERHPKKNTIAIENSLETFCSKLREKKPLRSIQKKKDALIIRAVYPQIILIFSPEKGVDALLRKNKTEETELIALFTLEQCFSDNFPEVLEEFIKCAFADLPD